MAGREAYRPPLMHYMLPQREGEPASNPAPTTLEHRAVAVQLCDIWGLVWVDTDSRCLRPCKSRLSERSATTRVEVD